jgi:hypothetical protein
MDSETIQQIATEVIARLPFGDRYWLLLAVNVLVAATAGALVALVASYLRTRGQNLATKHDFYELQKQLSATAKLVETIKSEVSQRDWAQRERTTLRRLKLEALLEKMHECEDYLDRRRDTALEGKGAMPERDYIKELDAMATLYLPELKSEVDRFVFTCRDERLLIIKLGQAVLNAKNDPTAQEAAYEDFRSKWNRQELRNAHDALTAAARSLLERIINEGPTAA